MELINEVRPYVGMLASYVIGSDQYAGRLIYVSKTGHAVTWARGEESDKAHVFIHHMTRRRNGEYKAIGSKYGYLKLGVAKTNLDPGF
jgi:hypothetical protein